MVRSLPGFGCGADHDAVIVKGDCGPGELPDIDRPEAAIVEHADNGAVPGTGAGFDDGQDFFFGEHVTRFFGAPVHPGCFDGPYLFFIEGGDAVFYAPEKEAFEGFYLVVEVIFGNSTLANLV